MKKREDRGQQKGDGESTVEYPKSGADETYRSYHLFWGDLHNHNAVGYAKGTLERSIQIAKEHLDFFAFTGHAAWHDMPGSSNMSRSFTNHTNREHENVGPGEETNPGSVGTLGQTRGSDNAVVSNRTSSSKKISADTSDRRGLQAHRKGFRVHAEHWRKTRRLIREAGDRTFVALLGYEWHSCYYGDYCILFSGDHNELFLPETVEELQEYALKNGALAIPHHVGYKKGWRGMNWDYFRSDVSPVVEVYSEHGCTLSDRSPYPMITHSTGPRSTETTIFNQLEKGLRFGFIASTDDHLGYPGAYNEGLVGIYAKELTAEAIFEAIRKRRTFAVTGDRIEIRFSINGHPMGSEMKRTKKKNLKAFVSVRGQDAVRSVEIIKNGKVVFRHFPTDRLIADDQRSHHGPRRERCPQHECFPKSREVNQTPFAPNKDCCRGQILRIQYGWGPIGKKDQPRTSDWDMTVRIENGTIKQAIPCFQSGPFSESRRDRLRQTGEGEIWLQSFTSREDACGNDPTKAVVCHLDADPSAIIELKVRKPHPLNKRTPLTKLFLENEVLFTDGFFSESLLLHRIPQEEECNVAFEWEDPFSMLDRSSVERSDWYMVKVEQFNHQFAWSSPIWVD